MLADASVPTALFALGASLAGYSLKGSWDGMFAIIGLKMIVMPVLVFILGHYVFHLQTLWLEIAVLFAAMPTGANAFLFAQRNDEAVPAISGAIAAGTALAAITTSVLLYLMDRLKNQLARYPEQWWLLGHLHLNPRSESVEPSPQNPD